jgi:anthranilate synthase component 1
MSARGVVLPVGHGSPTTLLQLHARDAARYPLLFDSAAPGPHGRWSILAAAPRYSLALGRAGHPARSDGRPVAAAGFLDALEQDFLRERQPGFAPPGELPFAGGWCVFLGFEVAGEIEPRLRLPAATDPWAAFALRIPAAVLHDAHSHALSVVAEPGGEILAGQIAADLRAVIDAAADSACPMGGELRMGGRVQDLIEEPAAWFLARAERLREAIAAGEIYQANLSRAWRGSVAAGFDAVALYARLRRSNPAPFGAYLDWGGQILLSSSPERLLRIEGGRISTRPIAGTRPRVPGGQQDREEIAALVAHPKERAEHVMLIDLERNDLGRICEAGSVRVDEFMTVESYAHVHHLVSEVSGRLRASLTPIAALRAVFPGGTITGCPKLRCMQLVAREEGEGRGAYTGALGYIGHDGSADFNILIRTLTLSGGTLVLRTGAGIVADSDPALELAETRAKARGLLAAFGRPS